ncbi:MAG: chemotaxis protein CheW [Gammaproteobacteria bacterium]|nr:chemotaxis protein CheW [Gammaproteobacteria bacterium]MDH5802103.1 chemotaxis protein CheW [Gammaproteobacteria bacterium]
METLTRSGSAIELLYKIEQLSKQAARGLPQRLDIKEAWSGIGFRIGSVNLVAPLTQVNELIHYPKLTLVPGTKKWVKGIANIRGTLLPIMDLQGFLGKTSVSVSAKTRVMVIKHGDLAVGLVVDEVLGLTHFSEENQVTAVAQFDESLRNFIQGAFHQDGVETLIFSMHALAGHPDFFKVAV